MAAAQRQCQQSDYSQKQRVSLAAQLEDGLVEEHWLGHPETHPPERGIFDKEEVTFGHVTQGPRRAGAPQVDHVDVVLVACTACESGGRV